MKIQSLEEEGYIVYFIFYESNTLVLASGGTSDKDEIFANAEERLSEWLSGKVAVMKPEISGEQYVPSL